MMIVSARDDGDVEAVQVVEEIHPARGVVGGPGRHGVDRDRSLLAWNLSTVPTRAPVGRYSL